MLVGCQLGPVSLVANIFRCSPGAVSGYETLPRICLSVKSSIGCCVQGVCGTQQKSSPFCPASRAKNGRRCTMSLCWRVRLGFPDFLALTTGTCLHEGWMGQATRHNLADRFIDIERLGPRPVGQSSQA